MSRSIWCEVVCSTCAEVAGGVHVYGGRVPMRELTAMARDLDWQVTADDFFCCRFCKDQHTANTASNGEPT